MKQELEQKTRRSILRARKIGLLLRGRNSGQAVVEYILIVSIAVAIIFIMKGAFSGMSSFIDNYLGKYTECLMAYGELPTLGIRNDDLKKHLSSDYKCESGFKPFTVAEGRPPVASGNAGGGSNGKNGSGKGNSNSNSSNSDRSSSADSSSSDSSRGDRDAVSGNGSGGGNGEQNGNTRPRRAGRSTADGIAGGDGNQRLIEEEGDEEGGRGRKRKPRESRIIYRDRPRYRAVLGDEAEQITKLSTRSSISRKPTSRSIAKAEGGSLPGPRSGLMRPPPEPIAYVEETKDEGWGFGTIVKWIFIIGIIVALVIFFGGQLLGYSNSDSS